MNMTMRAVALIALAAPLQLVAAPAPLVRETTDGFRRACIYALESATTSISVPGEVDCPLEREIDLFPMGDLNATAAVPPGMIGPPGILSGERRQGNSKACAYRFNDKTVYRSIPANETCPSR